jgi:hypothetical protein
LELRTGLGREWEGAEHLLDIGCERQIDGPLVSYRRPTLEPLVPMAYVANFHAQVRRICMQRDRDGPAGVSATAGWEAHIVFIDGRRARP